MNSKRRKAIREICDKLTGLQADLQFIKEEEDEARESMPESLEGSERYCDSEEASDAMESADGSLQDAIDSLEEICQER